MKIRILEKGHNPWPRLQGVRMQDEQESHQGGPEVAGSNPVPATNYKGLSPDKKRRGLSPDKKRRGLRALL